jgi:flagellar secretion chaperone FliS
LSGFGAKAYSKLGLETDVITADPHRLVLMLFDGALISIQRAKSFLAQKRIPEKCEAIGNALEIVDSGLRVSVDPSVDPEFAGRLVGLYKYVTMRLLQANLRNDVGALDEAARILGDLRSAWIKIGPSTRAVPAARPQSESKAMEAGIPAARRVLSAYQV